MSGFDEVPAAFRADLRAQFLAILGLTETQTRVYWENKGTEGTGAIKSTTEPPESGKGIIFHRVFIDMSSNPERTPGVTEHHGATIIEILDDVNRAPERIEKRAELIAAKLRRRKILSGRGHYQRHEFKPVGLNEELARYQGNLRSEWVVFEAL